MYRTFIKLGTQMRPILSGLVLMGATLFICLAATAAEGPVPLGSASTFGVLAGSTVTSSGNTAVIGDLGSGPGTAVDGFPPATVSGLIHAGDSAASQAEADLSTAYDNAARRTLNAITVSGNIGGQTLAPGLYKSTSSLAISSGDLTLDAQGDPNAVFVFQMASTLTTTSDRQVILSGGANAANIFWQVGSSATLGTTTIFKGTIMADQSITINTGAILEGRALARTGAVTMAANTVRVPNAITLVSAGTLTNPYNITPGQSINQGTKTITAPIIGNLQFYKILAPSALTIRTVSLSGGNIVIVYN